MSKKMIGQKVVFWNFYEDGYHDNWYDQIATLVAYEPAEIGFDWGKKTVFEMPVFQFADGKKIWYNKHLKVPMFSEEMLSERDFEREGKKYRFVQFITHKDSETGKEKDYLYQFQDLETKELVTLKPQIHNTKKFQDFKDFFGLELKNSWDFD